MKARLKKKRKQRKSHWVAKLVEINESFLMQADNEILKAGNLWLKVQRGEFQVNSLRHD